MKNSLQSAKSWLFVPANKPEFLAKSASRGASVIIVDMEDAVPAANKDATRLVLNQRLADIKQAGQKVVLRTNTEIEQLVADLNAIEIHNIDGLMLPKLESADYLNTVSDYLGRLELAQGKPSGSTALVGLIESPKAVMAAPAIALACERLACLAIGSEDLALSLGVMPSAESLRAAISQVLLAAKNANIGLLAVSGSLAQFRDLVAYEQQVISAASQGCTGALCIHPAQVSIVNQHYGPTPSQVAWANAVLAVVAANPQGGVWQVDGAMVDAPVVARAKALINEFEGDQ